MGKRENLTETDMGIVVVVKGSGGRSTEFYTLHWATNNWALVLLNVINFTPKEWTAENIYRKAKSILSECLLEIFHNKDSLL